MSSAREDFLVEIGTEELPPKSLRELEQAFGTNVQVGVSAAGLSFGEVQTFATPRRLAVLIQALETTQPAQKSEKRGPPVTVAFDGHGKPTRAALAFAESCGVDVESLERLETPKGTWLMHRAESPGRMAGELLPVIINSALASLPIARRMRWGSGDAEFVRPVHWVVLLLGDKVLPATILGQASDSMTRGHRFHVPQPLHLSSAGAYESTLLSTGMVVPDFAARRDKVRSLAEKAARTIGGEAVITNTLLDEVTALVEWPVAVVGAFSEKFLELPDEVLTATLQDHQRYFPVRDRDGKLMASFVAISNIESRDPQQVRHGNERVVRPRLSDARFFWGQDTRVTLASRVEQLRTVVFQHGLGSLYDKSSRLGILCSHLAPTFTCDPALIQRAALLAKTDLLTQMVGEFPELQGRMGFHYAQRDGEPESLALALGEQYLPRHAGDALPGSHPGMLLAVSDRLDTLAGAFALGKRPSGNKDPFGLRRAALGLVRILIEQRVDVDLLELLNFALAEQPVVVKDVAAVSGDLYEFILDRLRSYYLDGLAPGLRQGAVSAEMFESVRIRRPSSPLDFHERLLAVRAFMKLPSADSLAVANKRIANILKSSASGQDSDLVDPALFESPAEGELFRAVEQATVTHRKQLTSRSYADALLALADLKPAVDAFFDAVLVMSDDLARRRNRLALLQRLRAMFLDIADLSCMQTP